MPLPPFDMRGLLPPFMGEDAATADRSPYQTTMPELVAAMGTSQHRRGLIRKLIAYRTLLLGDGYIKGVQFIDGSFVENIELIRNRPPQDIDVFSILHIPPKYLNNIHDWITIGLQFWADEVVHRDKNKDRFSLDTYGIVFEECIGDPMRLINNTNYWYGLFSHQRETFAWKGFACLALDPDGDQNALDMLGGD